MARSRIRSRSRTIKRRSRVRRRTRKTRSHRTRRRRTRRRRTRRQRGGSARSAAPAGMSAAENEQRLIKLRPARAAWDEQKEIPKVIFLDEASIESYKPMTTSSIDRNFVAFGHGRTKYTSFRCPKNVQIIIPGLIGACNTDADLLKYWLYIKSKIEDGNDADLFKENFYWRKITGMKFANKIYTEGMPVPETGLTFCPFYCKKFRTKGGVYENKDDPKNLPGLCNKKYEPSYNGAPSVLTNRGLFKDCPSELVDHKILKSDDNTTSKFHIQACDGLVLKDGIDNDMGTSYELSNLINILSSGYNGKNIRVIILACTLGNNIFEKYEKELIYQTKAIPNTLEKLSVLQFGKEFGEFIDRDCSTHADGIETLKKEKAKLEALSVETLREYVAKGPCGPEKLPPKCGEILERRMGIPAAFYASSISKMTKPMLVELLMSMDISMMERGEDTLKKETPPEYTEKEKLEALSVEKLRECVKKPCGYHLIRSECGKILQQHADKFGDAPNFITDMTKPMLIELLMHFERPCT